MSQPLGRTDLLVPKLGMGAMTWGDPSGRARFTPAKLAYGGPQDRAAEKEAFDAAIAGGVSLFDTAAMYGAGASERRLGELGAGKDIIIATKFPSAPMGRVDSFPKALAASLERLGRETIDLYQHHYPSRRVPIPELMRYMADAVEAGKVKAVGVSNYSAEQMRLAHEELANRGIPLASNQVEYSLLHRQPEVDGVLDACKELGITLIAYMPLAAGALTGKYQPGSRAKGMRRWMPNFRGAGIEVVQPVVSLLTEIGERYGKTPGQVAIRWLVENSIVLPIPGAKNGKQAASNVDVLSFSLTADEVGDLSEATRAWRSDKKAA
jgi:aryl-alcohol dehydrogenase-like predicted oxidoreductase